MRTEGYGAPQDAAAQAPQNSRRSTAMVLAALTVGVAAAVAWWVLAARSDAPEVAAAVAPPKASEAAGPGAAAAVVAPAPAVRDIAASLVDGHIQGADETFKVKQGEQVALSFSTDRPIVLHLHGYEVHAEAGPQQPGTMSFKADMPGRFPVHEHREGAGNHRAVLFIEVHP